MDYDNLKSQYHSQREPLLWRQQCKRWWQKQWLSLYTALPSPCSQYLLWKTLLLPFPQFFFRNLQRRMNVLIILLIQMLKIDIYIYTHTRSPSYQPFLSTNVDKWFDKPMWWKIRLHLMLWLLSAWVAHFDIIYIFV